MQIPLGTEGAEELVLPLAAARATDGGGVIIGCWYSAAEPVLLEPAAAAAAAASCRTRTRAPKDETAGDVGRDERLPPLAAVRCTGLRDEEDEEDDAGEAAGDEAGNCV